jgi:predicted TPR repeat methyltransferase
MVTAEVLNTPDAWTLRAQQEPTSWAAAGWTEAGQRERFLAVLGALKPREGESLLDFGCGTGALAELLPRNVDYIGFDSSLGMIQRAQREHPGRRFQTWEPGGLFDLVACVGPFNLPGSKLGTWAALRRFWDRTGRALAVSLYAGTDERCLIYTLEECERFAAGEAYHRRVERWRHNDILMVLER